MTSATRLTAALCPLGESSSGWLRLLDRETEFNVFLLSAFMKRGGKQPATPPGCSLIDGLFRARLRSESALKAWIESFPGSSITARSWDICRRKTDHWRKEGIRAFALIPAPDACRQHGGDCPASVSACCPSVLFGKGEIRFDLTWLAVFNSRKPKSVSPDSDWLKALRSALAGLPPEKILFATSSGTLTYDMVGAYAHAKGLPFVLAPPVPLLQTTPGLAEIYGGSAGEIPVLSCMIESGICPAKRRLFCRDRILAAVSDVHLLLEIRRRGNLVSVLQEQQRVSPRTQVVFEPERRSAANEGNRSLLQMSPHAITFGVPDKPPSPVETRAARDSEREKPNQYPGSIEWRKYLFHYTKACPGPWPGQACRDFLLDLLDQGDLSGHSALDTLTRILQEGRLRAGARLIRGEENVVSWSSHPPIDFFRLRKWNTTLARWTVEPYGIGVRRDLLRSLGAKPVIYGRQDLFARLPRADKHRFQLDGGGHHSWRDEREWRLRGDLALNCLELTDYFIFVRTAEEKMRLFNGTGVGAPVLCLEI